MALKGKKVAPNARQDRAPFWVNCSVVDKNGVEHSLGRGIAGNLDSKTLRSLHNAEQSNQDAYVKYVNDCIAKSVKPDEYKPLRFNLVATVTIVGDEANQDLELF
jgi:hypothetical protein